jgi:hypothetical protein
LRKLILTRGLVCIGRIVGWLSSAVGSANEYRRHHARSRVSRSETSMEMPRIRVVTDSSVEYILVKKPRIKSHYRNHDGAEHNDLRSPSLLDGKRLGQHSVGHAQDGSSGTPTPTIDSSKANINPGMK